MTSKKIELRGTSFEAIAAALADRVLRHAEYAEEREEEGEDPGAAARILRWRDLGNVRGVRPEFEAALAAALECLELEQETLEPCPRCGGQLDRDPSGGTYCTECRYSEEVSDDE